MTAPGDPELNRTRVGQPIFDQQSSYPAVYPPPPPPRRPNGWLVPLIVAMVFALVGVIGIFAWLVVRDENRTDDVADAASSSVLTTAPQVTADQPTVTVTAATPTPQIPETTTVPPAETANWYAQIGAFNDHSNAVARQNANPGSQILPGSALGVSSNWVVAVPASSRSAAQAVCSNFAETDCYVKSAA